MACLYVWCSNVNLEKRIDQLKNEKYTVDAVNTKQLKMGNAIHIIYLFNSSILATTTSSSNPFVHMER